MERKEKLVLGAAGALIAYTLALSMFGPLVLAALGNRTVPNSGSVKAVGVGIYWEQACTNAVSNITWGTIDPGTNVDRLVYIRNEGNSPVTMTMTKSNWNPASASSYMTLNWDYGGQTINVNQVIPVKFTLSVSASVTGITNFSFDITVASSG